MNYLQSKSYLKLFEKRHKFANFLKLKGLSSFHILNWIFHILNYDYLELPFFIFYIGIIITISNFNYKFTHFVWEMD